MENNQTAFILFNTGDEKISADVRLEEETVWLWQEQMAELFERDRSPASARLHRVVNNSSL